jgi:hypothetical protein
MAQLVGPAEFLGDEHGVRVAGVEDCAALEAVGEGVADGDEAMLGGALVGGCDGYAEGWIGCGLTGFCSDDDIIGGMRVEHVGGYGFRHGFGLLQDILNELSPCLNI